MKYLPYVLCALLVTACGEKDERTTNNIWSGTVSPNGATNGTTGSNNSTTGSNNNSTSGTNNNSTTGTNNGTAGTNRNTGSGTHTPTNNAPVDAPTTTVRMRSDGRG